MILNLPEEKDFKGVEKDFQFAPETINKNDAEEYMHQINSLTEYTACYSGGSNIIETSIIKEGRKYSWFTNIIYQKP